MGTTSAERSKKWRAANQERANAYNRQWRLDHPENVKAWDAKCYAANPEKKKAHAIQWMKAHPEVSSAKTMRRRVRLRGGVVEKFLYTDIFERDNWICQLCLK